jgi:ParB/RepB/Spo0J family partition protein
MAGKRRSFADLNSTEVLDKGSSTVAVPIDKVISDPDNPRTDLGDLDDQVASILAVGQLQAVTAVGVDKYLNLFPEYKEKTAGKTYVVIMGQRRLAALRKAGIKTVELSVKNSLAASKQTLLAAQIEENDTRKAFNPMEQARAYSRLVDLLGSLTAAAKHLGKDKSVVSNRIVLLKLAPALQTLVESGDMPFRDARDIARIEGEEAQLAAWEARKRAKSAPKPAPAAEPATLAAVASPSPELDPEPAPAVEQPEPQDPAADVIASTPEVPAQTRAEPAPEFPAGNATVAATVTVSSEPAPEPAAKAQATPVSADIDLDDDLDDVEDDGGRDLVEMLGTTPTRIASTLKTLLSPEELGELAKILATEITVKQ